MSDAMSLLNIDSEKQESGRADSSGMVWIPGGTFWMGSNRHYSEEAPEHQARVDGFWIDRFPVTNRDFSSFVRRPVT